jgi:1,4-dihydroxy-2-naphthoate octaprenyltransferase
MIHRQTLHTWFWAIRPFSLSAAVVPVVVGSALAVQYHAFHWGLFLLILFGSLLVQSGTNLVDEYADHTSTDEQPQKIQAPYKVISRGLLTPRQVWYGALTSFGAASLIGIYLVLLTGWPLVLVCLASVAVAFFYSAGPKPLGHMALGELLVFIFMGPVMVLSSFYVLTHRLNWTVLWVSLPVACLVTAILIVNNLRDIDEDRQSGKITLVTLWGRQPVVWLYDALLLVAFSSLIILVLSGIGTWVWLLPLLLLPLSVVNAKMVQHGTERVILHQAMQGTAKLHLQFGVLLATALVIGQFL